jgi:ceramide glucosyltransferase
MLQFPLFWALLAVMLSGGAPWTIGCFAAAWVIRAAVVRGIDRTLRGRLARPARSTPLWLLPARDVLSAVEIAASFWNDAVVWRGHTMQADRRPVAPSRPLPDVTKNAEDETLPA